MSTAQHTCYVIMPFSKTTSDHTEDYWTTHFEQVLKPLIEENKNLVARRSTPLRGDILKQIVTDLVTATVVVADLTDARPNVYWELGVRQSFKHGTITIAQKGTLLPFDLAAKGTLFYDQRPPKWEAFRKNFKLALNDCLQNPASPDSHVLETLGGRGSFLETFRKQEVLGRLHALLLETDLNLDLKNKMLDYATKVLQGDGLGRMFPFRFNTPALELLITTRYLDQDDNFYIEAYGLYRILQAISDGATHPRGDPAGIAQWLVNQLSAVAEKRILRLQTKINAAKQKLLT